MSDSKITADLTSDVISEIDRDDNESISDESDEEKLEELKISKEFQENVKKFIHLDDLMRKKQEEITELKKLKKPCEKFILKYLDDIDENVIEITDGKLRKNKSETKSLLTQDIIKNAILEKIKDPLLVESILKSMEEKRPLNIHTNLKRTSIRPSRRGKRAVPKKDES
jgi:hypothetical protein